MAQQLVLNGDSGLVARTKINVNDTELYNGMNVYKDSINVKAYATPQDAVGAAAGDIKAVFFPDDTYSLDATLQVPSTVSLVANKKYVDDNAGGVSEWI